GPLYCDASPSTSVRPSALRPPVVPSKAATGIPQLVASVNWWSTRPSTERTATSLVPAPSGSAEDDTSPSGSWTPCEAAGDTPGDGPAAMAAGAIASAATAQQSVRRSIGPPSVDVPGTPGAGRRFRSDLEQQRVSLPA